MKNLRSIGPHPSNGEEKADIVNVKIVSIVYFSIQFKSVDFFKLGDWKHLSKGKGAVPVMLEKTDNTYIIYLIHISNDSMSANRVWQTERKKCLFGEGLVCCTCI